MPTTIPALRGRFGRFEYWLTTMFVEELVSKIRLPKDLPGWDDLSIEERYQRDINIRRVTREIAPYFATNADRFSGALVLAVINDDSMEFEPLNSFGAGGRGKVPQLYQSAAANLGFLTLNGDEMLVPLDGQHRAKAFKFAMNGTDDNGRPIPGIKSNTDLARDEAAVILIRFEPESARRIFSRINRYAKPTSKGDNLITDDDDAVAVMTRILLRRDGVLNARLVKMGATTLTKIAPEFTTLATFYEANLAIINAGAHGPGKPQDANEEQRETFEHQVRGVWEVLLQNIRLFKQALSDPSEGGDAARIQMRDEMLLGKPVGQLALVHAFLLLRELCAGIPDAELCRRLNSVNWSLADPIWHGVLMNPNGRVMSGRTTVNFAAQFIAHLGGAKLSGELRDKLIDHIAGDDEEYQLPPPVV